MNTKRDMAERIALRCGVTGAEAKSMVQHTLDEMIHTLKTCGRLELRGFGVFTISLSPARQARNPRTGETVSVSAKRVVKFKMGKDMCEQIQEEKCEGVS